MSERRLTFTDGHPDPEWLGALHDGELTSAEAREVAAHTATCVVCHALLADLAALSDLAPALEPELPAADYWPDLTERIVARVEEEREAARPAVAAAARAGTHGDAAPISRMDARFGARRATNGAAWRWAVPLAAVCGVALLSWRLILSRPSLMSEVGSPRPAYRGAPVAGELRTPAPDLAAGSGAREETASREQDAADVAGLKKAKAPAAAAPAGSAAGPATPAPVTRSEEFAHANASGPANESAAAPPPTTAQAPGAGGAAQATRALPDAGDAAAPTPPSATAEAKRGAGTLGEAVLGKVLPVPPALDLLADYHARLAGGVPLDSLLAESAREADTLWARFGPDRVESRDRLEQGAPLASARRAPARAVTAFSDAAPDSLAVERAIALEEARLALLKERRPAADRTAIERRLDWLRKISKKQGP